MRLLFLDKTEKVIKIITDGMIEGTETEQMGGAAQLDLTLSMSAVDQALLDQTRYVAVPRPRVDADNLFHMYAVQSFQNDEYTYTLTGIDAFNYELSSYGYIGQKRYPKASLPDMLKLVFDGTRWTVGHVDDVSISAIYFNYNPLLEALKKIVNAFGVEVQNVYTIENNVITKRTVNVYRQLGQETYKRFVYGSNALSVIREEARDNIYTAAVGRGKGEEKTDEDGNSTGGYGRKITFVDVTWSKTQGNPVDKPAGQEWVELPDRTKEWGQPDGKPRMAVQDFDDITDPGQLLQQTYDWLVDSSRPKVQFRSSVINVGWVNLGDRVIIVRFDLNIKYKTRVFKITRNLLDENQTEVEIGDYLVKSQAEREDDLNQQINTVDDKTDSVNDGLDKEADDRKDADDAIKDDVNNKVASINQIKEDIATLNRDVTDYINSGGKGIIQFLPNRDNPTSMRINSNAGGYFLLNDNGLGYFGSSGAKTAMDNRGNIVANVIAAGTSITSPNIIGGTITAASIVNADFRTQDAYGNETHVSAQGITTAKFVQAPVFYLPGSSGVWTLRPAGNRLVANSPADGKDYVVAGPAW